MTPPKPVNQEFDDFENSSNVFSIPAGTPFLKTLARALICGQFSQNSDGMFQGNPDWLADSIIYLPTRRASRALGIEILEAAKSELGISAIILPKIRTIGDLEEEETLFGLNVSSPDIVETLAGKKQVIQHSTRHLILARLAQRWVETMNPTARKLLEEEQIVLPSSASDALFLAGDLAHFMDQIEAEEGKWNSIQSLEPNVEGAWWQLTLNFLNIVMQAWPEYLDANGFVNPSEFRNNVIDFRIANLDRNPPKGLVIAAGTTGSIPATARLLAKIKSMPQGRIVLPGLDLNIPIPIIDRFCNAAEMSGESVASTHPQFGMIKLLHKLRTSHKAVTRLGSMDAALQDREEILNIALLPAEDTKNWVSQKRHYSKDRIKNAFADVALIEASNEYDEALAIALIMRETLSIRDKTAALVTPDRRLAQRVSLELERFDIEIDDSAGNALLSSKPAMFLRQILRCAFIKNDPVTLSSLLKNDLLHLGRKACDQRSQELLELALVRDAIILPDINRLETFLSAKRSEISNSKFVSPALKNLEDDEWTELTDLAQRISACFDELSEIAQSDADLSTDKLIDAVRRAAEKLSEDEEGNPVFYTHQGGAELSDLLQTFSMDTETGFRFSPRESTSVFDALLSGKRTRKVGRTRPRLHIYGTLEARLQNSDLVILSGLNEGVWPQTANNDPYLNRPMRAALQLPLPERRIGLAAHDFIQFSGNKEIFYSRSLRVDDTPTVASRWLQRLKTFLGEAETSKLIERGARYLEIGHELDVPLSDPKIIKRPAPCPPIHTRPKRLSITEIETWIRDPYAIYAKHVLGLYAMPPLIREADPALRGSIYHEVLAKFTNEWTGRIDEAARDKFSKIADAIFAQQNLPPEILAEWRPRFEPVGTAFLDWEEERRKSITRSHCEIKISGTIADTGFVLHGYADRIDEHTDETLSVIDYKTGSNPSMKQARIFSPQLSLEAALAMKGDIPEIPAKPIKQMLYVRLKAAKKLKIDDVSKGQNKGEKVRTSEELAEASYNQLIDQIRAYQKPDQAYLSQYAPLSNKTYAGDYDHLARIREWSIGVEDGSEADE